MDRETYLKLHWNRYPALPPQARIRGRLVLVPFATSAELVEIHIQSQGRVDVCRVANTQLISHLREGDLVAVLHSQVILLAPQLAPALVKKANDQDLKAWSLFIKLTRSFFEAEQFQEIMTPSLVSCPGTEPTLEVFATELKLGSRTQKMFLPTSPELHMKKAIHMGLEKIYEITRAYRNDEKTDRHEFEFWMIEWYRAYSDLENVENDVEKLISLLAENLPTSKKPKSIQKKTVQQLFAERFSFRLQPSTTAQELRQLAQDHGIDVHAASSIDDLFFILFFEIEKQMDPEQLLFVKGYPPYQAALARVDQEGWAERFEVYWQGFELANAFHELNDPEIQRQRSLIDLQKKQESGRTQISLDEDFFQALEAGMPPAAGIALGLERLFMALQGISEISKLRLF